MTKIFQKLEKISENKYKFACFSERLFVGSYPGGGGLHRGADGGSGATVGWEGGATLRWGGGWGQ